MSRDQATAILKVSRFQDTAVSRVSRAQSILAGGLTGRASSSGAEIFPTRDKARRMYEIGLPGFDSCLFSLSQTDLRTL
jgi:hypothetical protein